MTPLDTSYDYSFDEEYDHGEDFRPHGTVMCEDCLYMSYSVVGSEPQCEHCQSYNVVIDPELTDIIRTFEAAVEHGSRPGASYAARQRRNIAWEWIWEKVDESPEFRRKR